MPRLAIHPAEALADEMIELGIDENELVSITGLPKSTVDLLLRRLQPITEEIANALAKWLKTSPEFWLNLQRTYDERLAQGEVEEYEFPSPGARVVIWKALRDLNRELASEYQHIVELGRQVQLLVQQGKIVDPNYTVIDDRLYVTIEFKGSHIICFLNEKFAIVNSTNDVPRIFADKGDWSEEFKSYIADKLGAVVNAYLSSSNSEEVTD